MGRQPSALTPEHSTTSLEGLRVLFVADSLRVGETEHQIVDLALDLSRRGAEVEIATSTRAPLDAFAKRYGIRVTTCGSSTVERRYDACFAAELSVLVCARRPHIVHSHMLASSVAAAEALSKMPMSLVVHERTTELWRDQDHIEMMEPVYRRACAVIAASQPVRRRLIDDHGVPEAKIWLDSKDSSSGRTPSCDSLAGIADRPDQVAGWMSTTNASGPAYVRRNVVESYLGAISGELCRN